MSPGLTRPSSPSRLVRGATNRWYYSFAEELTMASDYSLRELMIVAAAREIRDGEVVFTGMRLPLLAYCVAKKLHAPRAVGLFEVGIVRDLPPRDLLYTMSDPPNIRDALWCTSMLNLMAILQRGQADMGFIGAAEVDRYGNVNTSYIGDFRRPTEQWSSWTTTVADCPSALGLSPHRATGMAGTGASGSGCPAAGPLPWSL